MATTVSLPMPASKTPAAGAARAAHGAEPPSATPNQPSQTFTNQLDQVLRQQTNVMPLTDDVAPLTVVLPKVSASLKEPAALLQDTTADDAATDPAARNGNVLAAAVLAMLGQGAATPASTAQASKSSGLSLTGNKTALQLHPGGAMTGNTADASPAGAAAATPIVDVAALAASDIGQSSAEPHKSTETSAVDLLAAPLNIHSGPGGTPAPHVLKMDAPANTPAFAQELGQQVAWLGGQDIKQARIRLRPEELGQLDVKVSVEHGRVDVSFTAQHPSAVTAVQQTLGQLDLMLAGHGLSLGQAQVGQQGGQGGGREQAGQAGDPFANEAESVGQVAQPVVIGLLDTFA
ncbi:flagellar hook-length control protein FliK [Dyella sp. OK004]|uniref:flagellar hook-length control protein FliK n=1 Tax=Dyella sp. OK004 TaxID=1855292 RepID=UPI0008EFFDB8|nr:flagellar hook-length control protein FliK [Dyella sp. OK004]SFR86909.1 flagellar hook-length control protein FliK [Dyella sp. OK004]